MKCPRCLSWVMTKAQRESEDKPIGQKIYRIQPLGGLFSDWLKTNLKDTQELGPTR